MVDVSGVGGVAGPAWGRACSSAGWPGGGRGGGGGGGGGGWAGGGAGRAAPPPGRGGGGVGAAVGRGVVVGVSVGSGCVAVAVGISVGDGAVVGCDCICASESPPSWPGAEFVSSCHPPRPPRAMAMGRASRVGVAVSVAACVRLARLPATGVWPPGGCAACQRCSSRATIIINSKADRRSGIAGDLRTRSPSRRPVCKGTDSSARRFLVARLLCPNGTAKGTMARGLSGSAERPQLSGRVRTMSSYDSRPIGRSAHSIGNGLAHGSHWPSANWKRAPRV